ncbi:MAG TPA: MFS transporter [Terriglobales bacterium]|nr:MFS transporter [Terriglobales bacterium]
MPMPDQQLTTHSATPASRPWHSVIAGFLGWMLDAFDFFVLVFLVDTLTKQFHVSKGQMVFTLTATLAMRPVGAVVFGLLADRYGRRRPLMANVIFFSVIELLCGFSPNYTVFLILRALYGIGMGGEWGVGASLAMEAAPPKWRGILSGFLQSGYPLGYLLAALAARFIEPAFGWRAMFWVGGAPALLALYIRSKVPESEAWKQHRAPTTRAILDVVKQNWKSAIYLVLMMTLMMFLSHGTQDLYPDFLRSTRGASAHTISYIAIWYNIGAVLGTLIFGHFSERVGRRRSMICALLVSLAAIPPWAFAAPIVTIAIAAFVLQAGVQGAWGVIPAHLNELSPDQTRGLLPGLAYQLGILIAAPINSIEYGLSARVGYSWALAGFEIVNIVLLIVVLALGKERKGRGFVAEVVPRV